MALEKSISTSFGLNGSYNKVQDIRGTRIEVATFYNQSARDNGDAPMRIEVYACPSSYFDEDILKQVNKTEKTQAYSYLKTLSVFSGGTDV